MTHAHAFRLSVNPLSHLSSLARLRSLARPAGQGLLLAALLLFIVTFAINSLAELVRQRLRDKYSHG